MQILKKLKNKKNLPVYLVFILISAISAVCYLLFAHKFGFYNDDWYLMYTAVTQGTAKFTDVFAIDRPFRAPFTALIFNLFGTNASLYSYSAWAIRLLGAISFFRLLRLVWPEQHYTAGLGALLLIVYPGFLDQPNAIDYQAHIWSFSFAIFSLTFTVRAIISKKLSLRILFTTASLVFGLLYLLLMEYFIGLEGLRFVLVWYILGGERLYKRLLNTFRSWMPFALSPLVFMIWRFFFFNNQRTATDISGMFTALLGNPLYRGLWSMVYLLQDILNDILFAWIVPVYQIAFRLRLSEVVPMLAVAIFCGLVVFLALQYLDKIIANQNSLDSREKQGQHMAWIGLAGVIFSLIPVILGNRHVEFSAYGRFSLPGSIGAIIFICGLLEYFFKNKARIWFPALLVCLAVMAHYSNSVNYAHNWEVIQDFWWQVSWRIPQIEPGTVLAADYAEAGISEDYFIWGPANLIYYPGFAPEDPTTPKISAILLNKSSVLYAIEERDLGAYERRGIINNQDLSNLLILSQPAVGSCVHVLDGNFPELSISAEESVRLAAGASKIERILLTEENPVPERNIFGSEPQHGWCYYYQKASLARQRGDWEEVSRLGDEAEILGLRPVDWVEWVPFLEAYAYLGNEEKVRGISPIIRENTFLRNQTCSQILEKGEKVVEESQIGYNLLVEYICQ